MTGAAAALAAGGRGRVFAVVGPSGAGKDTLLAGVVARDPRLHWARRVITRPAAATPGGEPYETATPEAFRIREAAGEFLLSWQAHGLSYGIAHTEFMALNHGRTVLFNGSRAGLAAAQAAFPGLVVIRITAPASVLAERLAARGRETHDDIMARLARATFDLPAGLAFVDVVNDATPEVGIARLLAVLQPVSA